MARLLFLFVISATTHLCESRSSHCTAGIFTAGKDAFVDCDFNPDESISNHHIYVTWSASNSTNNTKEVLTCWMHYNKNVPLCKLAEGYRYDGDISDHIRLLIPDVTPRFSGIYSCKLSMNNYSLSDFAACSLTVTDTTPDTRRSTPTVQPPCVDVVTSSRKQPENATSFSTLEIALIVVCSLLVIILVIVIVSVLCLPQRIISKCRDQCCKCRCCCSHPQDNWMPEALYKRSPGNVGSGEEGECVTVTVRLPLARSSEGSDEDGTVPPITEELEMLESSQKELETIEPLRMPSKLDSGIDMV